MRLSKYLFSSKREVDSGTDQFTARLIQGGFISRGLENTAGVYYYSNLAIRVLHKISNIIREELEKIDCYEVLLPILQNQKLWEMSSRHTAYYEERFWIEKDKLFLAPTAEESSIGIVYNYIKSYKKLPQNVFQITNKFRKEKRPRFGLVRCQEFIMKDAYSFGRDSEEAKQLYLNFCNAYINIFNRLELNYLIVKADSGEIGGDLSHEFVLTSPLGETDVFFEGEYNKKNIETLDKLISLANTFDEKPGFKIAKCLEIGHIFYIGTMYSDNMKLFYLDKDNKQKPYVMGCYGIGVSRLLSAIFASREEYNNTWPRAISPFKIHILDMMNKAEDLYQSLNNTQDILYDDRDISLGQKLNDADLIGIPVRVIVGNNIELVELDKNIKKTYDSLEDLSNDLKKYL